MSQVRMLAARVLYQVVQGTSLTQALESIITLNQRDRAFLQAVCFGACRFYTRLMFILNQLVKKPLPAKEGELEALLLIGLYQLDAMRVSPHAVVSETVKAADQLNKRWAKGLVNAVLRQYLRDQDKWAQKIATHEEAYFAHPAWWLQAIKAAYPEKWQAILMANNVKPPLIVRINQRKITRDDYLAKLHALQIAAVPITETEAGIEIVAPMPVDQLPGFAEGELSVQDGAAQWAVPFLLKNASGPCRILDACAAPGGKLTHILESALTGSVVVAVEKSAARMSSIHDNLTRLGFDAAATCLCADAVDPNAWWDGVPFDRILLDAPCSASGVVRRHPDIKLLRQSRDLPQLAQQQLSLLQALWPLLASGGYLLYATCSIFPQENDDVIREFLKTHPDAKQDKIENSQGHPTQFGWQMLQSGPYDGFYYARLIKC